jgi:cysteine desulfurase
MKLEEARNAVAAVIQCHADEVYFTSGGTEADNWAILGTLDHFQGSRTHLITASTEHHAVIDTVKRWQSQGGEATIVQVDADGRVDPQDIARAMTEKTALVSVMAVNNELGTVQDIAAIGSLCRDRGILFHTDCVQAYGKIPFRFAELNADLLSLSSHKIYGPKGVGALVIRRGVRIAQRFIGGSQERKLRTGTENTTGIIGFGKAAEICGSTLADEMIQLQSMRDRLESAILEQIPDVRINGSRSHRAPALLNVAFPGCEGEALLIALDRKGFCVSTGSACSAGALGASHVLIALGLDPAVAQSSIRFSFGRFNTPDDVDALMSVLPGVVARQRDLAPARLR